MKFLLFSKISFEVFDPVALVESYCFQSDFYANYDLIPIEKRKIEDVNKIGARIVKNLLPRCKYVTEETKNLNIFDYSLDKFLDLDIDKRNNYIRDLNRKTIKKLLEIKGIGFSKATKILHTLHPEIIPMIDNLYKDEYQEINEQWTEGNPEIFIDYYDNLKEGDNWQNLDKVFKDISENNLGLTKVRIFDILWWSYLKSKKLRLQLKQKWGKTINLYTIE
ncbi:MAG: hypothetical protein H3Z54_00870 [archaeon]|nr:hypothetical protein [archaeon]